MILKGARGIACWRGRAINDPYRPDRSEFPILHQAARRMPRALHLLTAHSHPRSPPHPDLSRMADVSLHCFFMFIALSLIFCYRDKTGAAGDTDTTGGTDTAEALAPRETLTPRETDAAGGTDTTGDTDITGDTGTTRDRLRGGHGRDTTDPARDTTDPAGGTADPAREHGRRSRTMSSGHAHSGA